MKKEARVQDRERSSPFNKCCWENQTATCKTIRLQHFLASYTKINSKWINDLIVRPESYNSQKRTFFNINCNNIFLDLSIKAKINKQNLIKLKSSCTKGNHQQNETTYRMGENICKQCNQQGLNFQNMQTIHTTQYQQKNSVKK